MATIGLEAFERLTPTQRRALRFYVLALLRSQNRPLLHSVITTLGRLWGRLLSWGI